MILHELARISILNTKTALVDVGNILSFNGEKAFEYLKKLAVDIGPRPSGTETERRAAEWILSEFKKIQSLKEAGLP